MNDQAKALAEWMRSDEGQRCLSWPVSDQEYLKNRLWWAFNAGYTAGEKSSQFANSECGADENRSRAMKMHVDYEWSVLKLDQMPDRDDCAAGIPLQHLCDDDCTDALAAGVCTGCGYTVKACESAKGRGCLACCPECCHPTEDELRAQRRSADPREA